MSKSARVDVLQGTLDLLILRTLQLGAMHGWAISERIQQASEDVLRVNQGSLYPALHRLERKGLVAAKWENAEGNQKREFKYYRLTAAGKKHLVAEESKWKRMSDAIARIMWPA